MDEEVNCFHSALTMRPNIVLFSKKTLVGEDENVHYNAFLVI